jgi:protein transport protein SEC24
VRVLTTALPLARTLADVLAGASAPALAALFAAKAVARSLSHSLEDTRGALLTKMADVLGAYRAGVAKGGAGELVVGENLRVLPVLMLAILKTVCGCDGRGLREDF